MGPGEAGRGRGDWALALGASREPRAEEPPEPILPPPLCLGTSHGHRVLLGAPAAALMPAGLGGGWAGVGVGPLLFPSQRERGCVHLSQRGSGVGPKHLKLQDTKEIGWIQKNVGHPVVTESPQGVSPGDEGGRGGRTGRGETGGWGVRGLLHSDPEGEPRSLPVQPRQEGPRREKPGSIY